MKVAKYIFAFGFLLSLGFFLYYLFVCDNGILGCLGSMQNLLFPIISMTICIIGFIIVKIISRKKS